MAERTFNAGIVGIQTTGHGEGSDIRLTLAMSHKDMSDSELGGWLLEAKRQGNEVAVTIAVYTMQGRLSFDTVGLPDEMGEMEQEAAEEAAEAADKEEAALTGAGV